jgi:hypothetical protein
MFTTKTNSINLKDNKQTTNRTPAHNRRLAQWRVQWLIKHSTSHQLLWYIDSFALRNPPERKARNRCGAIRRHIGSPDCMRRCGLERLTSAHLRDFSAARSFATPAPKPRKSGDPLPATLGRQC